MDKPSTSGITRRRVESVNAADDNFEAKIARMWDEVEVDEDFRLFSSDDSDIDPMFHPNDEHLSSEISHDSSSDSDEDISIDDIASVDVNNQPNPDTDDCLNYTGKNGCVWNSKEPPRNRRVLQHNIIRGMPGLTKEARKLGENPNKLDVWSTLFDDDMILEITTWTNVKLEAARNRIHAEQKSSYRPTDTTEIKAFIALLMLCSISKSGHEDVYSLFSTDSFGRPLFRAVMSVKRFLALLHCLRFDNPQTREIRKMEDKGAAISGIFSKFIKNCQTSYSLSEYACVDEMLIPFRGKCSFRVYMPKKPAKYGLKVMCLTDARTSYFFNGYIYCGKGSDGAGLDIEERELSIPTQSVLKLTKPIENTNRNVTADNWFSSVQLVKELQKRRLTYVGTLRKNKKEIPPEFVSCKERQVGSSIYGFQDNITLLSYVPKKNKCVLLVSSMHNSMSNDDLTGKPEMVCFYNSTKGGVDTLDQKCAVYSCNRRSRRWPLAIFFTLVNISLVNSCILYLCFKNILALTRYNFTKDLALELVRPHLERRIIVPSLHSELRLTIQEVLEGKKKTRRDIPDVPNDKLERKRKCSLCPYQKNRNTGYKCVTCDKPICLECSRKVCVKCLK